jgi:carboxylesterase
VGVLPGAEPYARDGGAVGVLLCHGFTGTPQSLRPWGAYLAERGLSVRLPLLPGHGTTWQDMNRTRWQDWYGCVEGELLDLRRSCQIVVVGGLSMGGCLALRLALDQPDAVDGLLLVNPVLRLEDPRLLALPVLRRVVPSFPGIGSDIKKPGVTELAYERTPLHAAASLLQLYATTARRLGEIRQPLLLFRSAEDHVVPPSSGRLVMSSVSSKRAEEVVCQDSYHVATLDNDAPMIFERSAEFVADLAAAAETEVTTFGGTSVADSGSPR